MTKAIEPFTSEFEQAISELADAGTVSEVQARNFFGRFQPLDRQLGQLQHDELSDSFVQSLCRALDKLYRTETGQLFASEAQQYAVSALQASQPQLRRLGCKQLAKSLEAHGSQQLRRSVSGRLLHVQALLGLLADPDSGVAAEATQALQRYAGQADEFRLLLEDRGGGSVLRQVIASSDATVRMRALYLIISVGAMSSEHASLLDHFDLLQPLNSELQYPPRDLLSCMAALQLVHEVAQQSLAASGALLAQAVLAPILSMCQSSDDLLACPAFPAAGALLAASIASGTSDMDIDSTGSRQDPTGPHQRVLAACSAAIDPDGDASRDVQAAAVEGIGELGTHYPAAAVFLQSATSAAGVLSSLALSRANDSHLTIAALHSLASIAGADRHVSSLEHPSVRPHPPSSAPAVRPALSQSLQEEPTRRHAVLIAAAEGLLQDAVSAGAAGSSSSRSIGGALCELLMLPFVEVRVATFRLMSALALRTWGAEAICSHQQLWQILADGSRETARHACEYRFASIQALCEAAQKGNHRHAVSNGASSALSTLSTRVPELQALFEQGLYRAGQSSDMQIGLSEG